MGTMVEIRRMAGPCANGCERNGGTRWHAVVGERAICGARCRSFWSDAEGEKVTCPRCLTRLPAPSPAATDTEGADEGAGKET